MPHRLIVLTDINPGLENDDIESLVRLLLYSNDIDIEAIVAVTSSWYKKGARARDIRIIRRVVDAYATVKSNLDAHADGYPEADYLHSITHGGIPAYGSGYGDGFGEERFDTNPGVQAIIEAIDRDDDRPLWISLWGGANTLAQAVDVAERTRSSDDFDRFLRKIRIVAISDQDAAGHWLRERFGDRLFSVVSPSPASGSAFYRHATWPGIAADRHSSGSEDGDAGGGFTGADRALVSRRWLRRHVRRQGPYGKVYPIYRFIMEGDTPAYLSLIPNGLNDPENPGYGGWGGRYAFAIPDPEYSGTVERHPIWTNASDTVTGIDGATHRSPQATIWRWREAVQHDFAARMRWSVTSEYTQANHPPEVRFTHSTTLPALGGERVEVDASPTVDPDGDALTYDWFFYPEAGTYAGPFPTLGAEGPSTSFVAPDVTRPETMHVIVAVRDDGAPALTRYGRVIVEVAPARS